MVWNLADMNETQKPSPEVFYKKKLLVKISQYLQENIYSF